MRNYVKEEFLLDLGLMFWYFMEGFERNGITAIYSASGLIRRIDILCILIFNGLLRYAAAVVRQQVNLPYSSVVFEKTTR